MAICDRCKHPIAGNSKDPICITSLGTHHYACMRLAWKEHDQAQVAHQAAASERRSAAGRRRWAAKKTPATQPQSTESEANR